jgi:hypothetical protein
MISITPRIGAGSPAAPPRNRTLHVKNQRSVFSLQATSVGRNLRDVVPDARLDLRWRTVLFIE